MASEVTSDGQVIAPLNITAPTPLLNLRGFQWDNVDAKIHGTPVSRRAEVPNASPAPAQQPVPLGDQVTKQLGKPDDPFVPPFPLEHFNGAFAGNGFNLIWRPRPDSDTNFPLPPPAGKQKPEGPSDNILELNLTLEQLTFGQNLGHIPNRGLDGEPDIDLAGVPYLQTVQDTTDPEKGSANNQIHTGIHFEPGVWLFVPKAKFQKQSTPTIVRMASIPHGTTINAQGVVPDKGTASVLKGGVLNAPIIKDADSTPFSVQKSNDNKITIIPQTDAFAPPMDAKNGNTFRIPQNLTNLNKTGRITSTIIKNPHKILQDIINSQKVLEHITFEVSTGGQPSNLNGGGTANISFLMGQSTPGDTNPPPNPIAHAAQMTSRFWILLVEYKVNLLKSNVQSVLKVQPEMPKDSTAPTPWFNITTPVGGVPKDMTIFVPGKQIMYSQTVMLNFKGLSWPHISIATLVPSDPQPFPMKL